MARPKVLSNPRELAYTLTFVHEDVTDGRTHLDDRIEERILQREQLLMGTPPTTETGADIYLMKRRPRREGSGGQPHRNVSSTPLRVIRSGTGASSHVQSSTQVGKFLTPVLSLLCT
jgi:hypothetical protein